MPEPVAAWVLEWRVFSDHAEAPLRGNTVKNAITRRFFATLGEALAEQRLLRMAHAGNLNFVSSVVPWTPVPAKPRKAAKPHHKGRS